MLEVREDLSNEDYSCVRGGFQYAFNDKIKISPNLKINIPKNNNSNPEYFAFISFYFGI
jgi:hypothetical protein